MRIILYRVEAQLLHYELLNNKRSGKASISIDVDIFVLKGSLKEDDRDQVQ